MLFLDTILGSRLDPELAERLHDIGHRGRVEVLRLRPADMARKRLRGVTDAGTPCAIAIPRDAGLFDGAVLLAEPARAVVVQSDEQRWLRLRPADAAAALELGYHAGNLHWRVRFDGADLLVALEGPADRYLDRIRPLVEGGGATVMAEEIVGGIAA